MPSNYKQEVIDKPDHYVKNHERETIETLKGDCTTEEFRGHLVCQVKRYLSRYKYKGDPQKELAKAQWYLNRLIKEVSDEAN